jgi:hypothetical protein
MHADARDEVDYGGGISRERQNLDWFQIVCGSSRARVYIGAAEENPSNMGHAHVAHPSRLQQLTIRERPEPTSCDASIKDSVKRSVFLCSKDNLGSEAQFRKPRRARASRRVETSERGGGARVWHFSSHSLTKWCNTPPYMLVYISSNFLCGTKLSSHLLPLCS